MKLFFRLDTPNNISNVATPGPCDGMVDITDLKSVAFGRLELPIFLRLKN